MAIGAGMLLLTVAPALAVDCGNGPTGAYSSNYCTIKAKRIVRFMLGNNGNVTNNVTTNTNTGGNQNNQNSDASLGGVLTGNATANINPVANTVNNVGLNVNQTAVLDTSLTGSGNSITGYGSTNNVTVNVNKRVGFMLTNTAFVTNNVNTTVNTGNNQANLNTVGGGVGTGDALVNVGVSNNVNSSSITISQ